MKIISDLYQIMAFSNRIQESEESKRLFLDLYEKLMKKLSSKQEFDPEIYKQLRILLKKSLQSFLLGFRTLDSLISLFNDKVLKF